MKSTVIKRSVIIGNHKTSVTLEDEFWRTLKEIAKQRDTTLAEILSNVDEQRSTGNLSSAIRLFVLEQVRAGHRERSVPAKAASSVAEEGGEPGP